MLIINSYITWLSHLLISWLGFIKGVRKGLKAVAYYGTGYKVRTPLGF
jgi:hypothetical protein